MGNTNELIAEIERPGNEILRVETHDFKDHWYASARVYYDTDDGEWRPSRKGITLNTENLPLVILAFRKQFGCCPANRRTATNRHPNA